MITVGRLAPINQWDQNMLDQLLANELYPTGLEFNRVEGWPKTNGCILFLPGRYWQGHQEALNQSLADYEWVLIFRTSDESDWFDWTKIEHPNIKWWIQNPRTDRSYPGCRLIGCGFPPHFNKLGAKVPHKDGIFLSAQNNQERRKLCFERFQSHNWPKPVHWIYETPGFTQGLPREEYVDHMIHAQVAPCPAGIFTPDTFRVYEALESHTVPIADDQSPEYNSIGYWRTIHPDAPFPILVHAADWDGYCIDQLEIWPVNANEITAWWMREKRKLAHWLKEDLEELGAL